MQGFARTATISIKFKGRLHETPETGLLKKSILSNTEYNFWTEK